MSDPGDEIMDKIMEEADKSRLNSQVAIAVAIIVTIMALGKVKDDNVCQGIQKAQAAQIDQWSYYQAKGMKQNLALATVAQISLARETVSTDTRRLYDEKVASYQAMADKYEKEKADIKTEADGWKAKQEALESRDDQFDLSDAALSIALSLMALTALTQKKWLMYVGLVFAVIGLIYTAAGFMAWNLSPGFVARLLG